MKFLGVRSEKKSPTNIKQKVSASRNFLEFDKLQEISKESN